MKLSEVTRFTPKKHVRMSRLQVRQRRTGRRNRIYSWALIIWREKRHELLAHITRQKLTIVDHMETIEQQRLRIEELEAALCGLRPAGLTDSPDPVTMRVR